MIMISGAALILVLAFGRAVAQQFDRTGEPHPYRMALSVMGLIVVYALILIWVGNWLTDPGYVR